MKRITPVIFLIVAAIAVAAVAGVAIGSQVDVWLASDNLQLHALLNKAESRHAELVAEVDGFVESAYWQGRYDQCLTDGLQETTCYSMMQTLMEQAR